MLSSHILTCILAPRFLPHNYDYQLLQKDFGKLIFARQLNPHGISDTLNSTATLSVSFPSWALSIGEKMEQHLCSQQRTRQRAPCSVELHFAKRTDSMEGFASGISLTASCALWDQCAVPCYTVNCSLTCSPCKGALSAQQRWKNSADRAQHIQCNIEGEEQGRWGASKQHRH